MQVFSQNESLPKKPKSGGPEYRPHPLFPFRRAIENQAEAVNPMPASMRRHHLALDSISAALPYSRLSPA